MSKRLQVVLDEDEMEQIQRLADEERMTVSEWVRQSLRAARRQRGSGDLGRKLEAIRLAARHSFPTADVGQMLAEVERGYLGEPAP